MDKLGQKPESEASTNLRPPILVVTKESGGKGALATQNKVMGNKESKDQVATQQDGDAEEMVILETSNVKEPKEDASKTETKEAVSKDTKKKVSKETKTVAKETKVEKVEENDLLSQLNGFDDFELNEAGVAYMYGGRYLIICIITYITYVT